MKIDTISFKETAYFSKLMLDYLQQKEGVQALYGNTPNLEGFRAQIKDKENYFSDAKRILLSSILETSERPSVVSFPTAPDTDLFHCIFFPLRLK